LVYDANAKVQPEFDPRMIVLVRRVRVRPTLIFQGRVEGVAVAAVTPRRLRLPQPLRQKVQSPLRLPAIPSLIASATSSVNCGPATPDRSSQKACGNSITAMGGRFHGPRRAITSGHCPMEQPDTCPCVIFLRP